MSFCSRAPRWAMLTAPVVLIGAVSCDETGPLRGAGRPAAMLIVDGQDLTGTVGKELTTALAVKVVDSANVPVVGQVVNFRVTSGGGSVFAGASATNSEGIAKERWTLGTIAADSQRLEARAVDNETGQAIVFATFRATATADAPSTIVRIAGDSQTVASGQAAPDSLIARVNDQYGNPVSGVSVTWTPATDAGSVSPATSTTNADGLAKTRWTIGTNGAAPQRVTPATTSIAGPVFNARLVGRSATQLILATPAAGARMGQTFTTQPVIRFADEFGNTDESATSTVELTVSAPATREWQSGSTNWFATATNGVASFNSAGMVGPVGTHTLTYSVTLGGTTRTVTQQIDLPQGAATKYAVTASAPLVVGTPVTISAQFADAGSNPIATAGRSVTWGRTRHNGTFSSPTSVTNANGLATVTFTPATTQNDSLVVLSATDGSISGNVTLSVSPGPPATLAFSTQPVPRGWRVIMQPTSVEVRDSFGNRVESDSRQITISLTGGPALSGTLAKAAVRGRATFSDLLPDAPAFSATLVADDGPGGLSSVASNAFEITTVGDIADGSAAFDAEGDTVFYTTPEGSNTPKVFAIGKNGGPSREVAQLKFFAGVKALKVHGSFIDVLEHHEFVSLQIRRVPRAGGPIVNLDIRSACSGTPESFQLEFDGTYFVVGCRHAIEKNTIFRVRASDGEIVTLTDTSDVGLLAVVDGYFYYADDVTITAQDPTPNTTVYRRPLDLSAGPTAIATITGRMGGFAIVGNTMYWSENDGTVGSSRIKSAPVSGGTATPITSGVNAPRLFADGTTALYYQDQCAVKRIALPTLAQSTPMPAVNPCVALWFVGPSELFFSNVGKGPK